MKKALAFRIHIQEPCQQDWNEMAPQIGGRYCNQCTKVVYDFSQMTDAELIQFFKTKPADLCGRFHQQQINREIKPVNAKRSLPGYLKKIVTAVFAALSFRSATSQVQKAGSTHAITQASVTSKNPIPESVTISGRVTKGNNEPVANAKVSVDSLTDVYTNSDGKYSIHLTNEMVSAHNLYFSFEGFEKAVRTFHPLMGSTDYDVRLMSKKDCQGYFFQGLTTTISIKEDIEFGIIKYKKNSSAINDSAKASLAKDAEILKAYPQITIKIMAYGSTPKAIKIAKLRVKQVHVYLVSTLGIGPDRIREVIEENGPDNIVDIAQDLDLRD